MKSVRKGGGVKGIRTRQEKAVRGRSGGQRIRKEFGRSNEGHRMGCRAKRECKSLGEVARKGRGKKEGTEATKIPLGEEDPTRDTERGHNEVRPRHEAERSGGQETPQCRRDGGPR